MGNATNRWLDRLAAADKANGGTGSDYKLAQVIGVDRQRISRYRRELEQMGNDAALIVAQQLGVHPMVVLAEIAAEKSRDHRVQRLWSDAAKLYGKKAAYVGAVILAASGIVPPAPANANWGAESPSPTRSGAASSSVYYVKPRHARRRRRNRPRFRPGRVVTLAAALSEVTATSLARGVH